VEGSRHIEAGLCDYSRSKSFAILRMMRGMIDGKLRAGLAVGASVQGRHVIRRLAIVGGRSAGLLNKQLQPFSQTHPPPSNSLTASIPQTSTPIPHTIHNGHRSKSLVPLCCAVPMRNMQSPTKPLDPLTRSRDPMPPLIDRSLTFFYHYSVKGIQHPRLSNCGRADRLTSKQQDLPRQTVRAG
jgi:hypothetical protein